MGISGGDSLLHRDGEGGCRGRLGSTIVGGLERSMGRWWVGSGQSERNRAGQVVEMTRSTDCETSMHVARKMSTPVNVDAY